MITDGLNPFTVLLFVGAALGGAALIVCHLAYSVATSKAEALPSGRLREIVTVKVRFDEATISARRPRDGTLTPNSLLHGKTTFSLSTTS
jgi:hypothetical protein